MKVFHVCELGSPLVPFATFNFDVLSEHAITHGSSTSLERFYAFGWGRIAKNECTHLHSTAPGRHQGGSKTTPRKRLPLRSDGHVAF